MPRYFFHLYDDMAVVDDEGTELPDVEAARRHAIVSARDMACQEVKDGKLVLWHRIEVEDEDGRAVLTIPYRSAFKLDD